jgi:hypothetical protein
MQKAAKTTAKAAPAPSESALRDEPGTERRSKRGGNRLGAGRKRKRGGDRPSTYTEALGAEICERLTGGETLDSICRDVRMPESRVTIFRWRRANAEFDKAYLAARVDQMEVLADEVLEIAATEQDIQRARVKLEARRIVMTRLASRYGPAAASARTQEQQPVDLHDTIRAARQRIEALIEEVGRERAQRVVEDEMIAGACAPNPGTPDHIIRAQERAALHVLERRKQALLAGGGGDGSVH